MTPVWQFRVLGLNPSKGFRCRIPECDGDDGDFSFSGPHSQLIQSFCTTNTTTIWIEDSHLNSDFGPELFPAKSNGEPDHCRFYKVDFLTTFTFRQSWWKYRKRWHNRWSPLLPKLMIFWKQPLTLPLIFYIENLDRLTFAFCLEIVGSNMASTWRKIGRVEISSSLFSVNEKVICFVTGRLPLVK